MILEPNVPDEPLRFVLRSSDPSQPTTLLAQASSVEEKDLWGVKINVLLDAQRNLLAALQQPRKYQEALANSSAGTPR